MKHLRKVLSLTLALLFMLSLAVTAFAETYVINDGSITVSTTSDGSSVKTTVTQDNNSNTPVEDNTPIVIKGNGEQTGNTISISAEADTTASVTLDGVNINTGEYGDAAVSVSGSGNVILELDGTNTVTSGDCYAGVEKSGDGSLTITDDNGTDGSLTANGGIFGAGIGGGMFGDASNITIEGGTVNANGGEYGSGIGSGSSGDADTIIISGGTVYAAGGSSEPGIGGENSATGITISGDAQVNVSGGGAIGVWGAGAAIGTAGDAYGNPGTEVDPDTSGLTTGSVTYYPAGTSIDSMKDGTATPTKTIPEPQPSPADAAADPFLGFCLAVAEKIKAAPENGTLEINAGRYTGLASFVLEALAQRPDLTLTVTWTHGAETSELTIPAGTDLSSLTGGTVAFADIAGLVG